MKIGYLSTFMYFNIETRSHPHSFYCIALFYHFLIQGPISYLIMATILEVLEMLREKVRRKRPEILPTTHGSCTTTMHLLTRHCL